MAAKGLIYVMDMGSSLSEALIRRVIDMGQYCVFRKWDMKVDPAAELMAYRESLKGIIVSGSALNINSKKNSPPSIPLELLQHDIPVLGICYGHQLLGHLSGANVVRCWDEQDPTKRTKEVRKKDKGEQGPTVVELTPEGQQSILFHGLGSRFPIWMKHNWMLENLPEGWVRTSYTGKCPIASMEQGNKFSVQFHPEPYNSLFGRVVLHNFLSYACRVLTPYF